jgi:hypothetical protein
MAANAESWDLSLHRSPLESQSGYQETIHLRPAPSSSLSTYGAHEIKVPLALSADAPLHGLNRQERRIMDNIVGCLTKDGKKSVAQKIVLEAMGIVRSELEKQELSKKAAAAKGEEAKQSAALADQKKGAKRPVAKNKI